MQEVILIHYGEIYLKGENKPFFEKKLVSNIDSSLSQLKGHKQIKRIRDRLLIEMKEEYDKDVYKKRLRKVFGIANFSFAKQVEQDLKKIKQASWEQIKEKDFETFAVDTNRAQKDFSYNSMEVNEKVGSFIWKNLEQQGVSPSVDLETPDQKVFVEIVQNSAFISSKKHEGARGLPVGTAGKVVSLISNGIDSPVSSWKMIKRGCESIFCHFHSFPFTNKKSKINAERLVEKLNEWQGSSEVFFINLHDIQKEIIKEIDPEYRLIFYRREMFILAEQLAKQAGALGLVTGESVGQVASQTLENMRTTSEAVELPIYRPNIGEDKQEIIKIAKKIGTFEISSQQVEDCCTYMVAEHPVIKSNLQKVLEIEESLDLQDLRKQALEDMEKKVID